MREILIVGGGASGILVATQIARQASSPLSVHIAEPNGVLGRGLAYGTGDEGHLLNVPAGRMSALPSDPSHFKNWAGCGESEFISRRRYGRYLLETFLEAQKGNRNASFLHQRCRVERIERKDSSFQVTAETGPLGKFDAVVLALGHGIANPLPLDDSVISSPKYINDPWRDGVPSFEGTLLSIGTGLTFIDLALSHLRRNDTNAVIGLSRTGDLPQPHLKVRSAPLPVPHEVKASPAALRSYIDGENDWRAAQDGVRHLLPEIWFGWSEDQKLDFWNQHLRWWNVHRHRMAPEIEEELSYFMGKGRLKIVGAPHQQLRESDSGFELKTGADDVVSVDYIVNSTGYRSMESSPLHRTMAEQGLVALGPLGLGIRSNYPSFEVIDQQENIVEGLFAIGPVLLGERFETTAIPELREQAEKIATDLS